MKGLYGQDINTNGKLVINKAFAGVGNPIKEFDCLVSILNFANRMAEKTGIVKAIQTKQALFNVKVACIKMNIIAPGATPNVTMSANESSCLPISE